MKKIKTFFEYLFYKYYWFQIRIGNASVAPFFSTLMIAFVTFLYISITFMIFIFFIIPNTHINIKPKGSFIVIIILFLIFYFLFLYKMKYKYILKKEELNNENNFWAIFLPLFAFILINVCWILKMLQNSGKI